jgi:hypothetical protein
MGRRQLLATLLLLAFVNPGWTTPELLGTVLRGESATVRGTTLIPGTSIFSGDTIEVALPGSASIALVGGGVVLVASQSKVRLAKEAGRIQLELKEGRAWFCVSEKTLIEVQGRLADAVIQSDPGLPAVAVLEMLSPTSAIITVVKGRLVVSTAHDAKSVTLREGQCVELAFAPAIPQAGLELPGARVAILSAVVTTLTSVIAARLNEDLRHLSDIEKKNAVSPFRLP